MGTTNLTHVMYPIKLASLQTGYYIDFTWFLGGKNATTPEGSFYPYVSTATSVLNLWWAEWDPSDKEDEVKVLD